MADKTATRADDELVLTMLRWRSKGHTTPAIGRHLGMPGSYVRTLTNRVKAADEACGEDTAGAYW